MTTSPDGKRPRLAQDTSILSLSEQEILQNSSYIINQYAEMTNEELETWQKSILIKCLHENKVNYLLDQLKSMDPGVYSPNIGFLRCGSTSVRPRSLSFEYCAISMAIDSCGLQQQMPNSSESQQELDTIRNDSTGLSNEVIPPVEPIDHSNFIEAAVAVAIQEKGLSPPNSQVSPNR